MTRKILSFALVLILTFLLCTVSFVTISAADEAETDVPSQVATSDEASADEATPDSLPPVKEGCNRYFFQMPIDWCNSFSRVPGIYWWEGTDACPSWPGVQMLPADAPFVFYYDVPKDVTAVYFNNFIDGGVDRETEIYYLAKQTCFVGTEYYDPGENDTYPEGLPTFDKMIFVPDPELNYWGDFEHNRSVAGEWHYYYGGGLYGFNTELEDDYEYEMYTVGDVNNDNDIDIKDVTIIQKEVAQIPVIAINRYAADVDADRKISIKDATEIQKYIADVDKVYSSIGYQKLIWF